MPGLAELALGAVPIAGGALLAASAGQLRAPDFRATLRQDMELLERIPEEQTQRRAELQRTIDARIDDLVAASEKSRALRQAARAYRGNWRDIVLFICAVLFTVVWWNVNHHRTSWLLMFIVMIVVSVVTALYAARGALRGVSTLLHQRDS
jgi:Flp pilus assembly protein TadB